jgi:hypothetical protein
VYGDICNTKSGTGIQNRATKGSWTPWRKHSATTKFPFNSFCLLLLYFPSLFMSPIVVLKKLKITNFVFFFFHIHFVHFKITHEGPLFSW